MFFFKARSLRLISRAHVLLDGKRKAINKGLSPVLFFVFNKQVRWYCDSIWWVSKVVMNEFTGRQWGGIAKGAERSDSTAGLDLAIVAVSFEVEAAFGCFPSIPLMCWFRRHLRWQGDTKEWGEHLIWLTLVWKRIKTAFPSDGFVCWCFFSCCLRWLLFYLR